MVGYSKAAILASLVAGAASWSCDDSGWTNELSIKWLGDVDELAVCNDGSEAAYYYKPSATGSSLYMVYLGGGGWCYDSASCASRNDGTGYPYSDCASSSVDNPCFMSSKDYKVRRVGGASSPVVAAHVLRVSVARVLRPASCHRPAACVARCKRMCRPRCPGRPPRPGPRQDTCGKTGMLDANATANAAFADANLVYLPYCTSDAHLGDAGASDATGGFHFRGRRVVDAVLADLAPAAGATLVLAGGSAGGRGAMALLDGVAAAQAARGVRTLGLLDSPYYLDSAPCVSFFKYFFNSYEVLCVCCTRGSVRAVWRRVRLRVRRPRPPPAPFLSCPLSVRMRWTRHPPGDTRENSLNGAAHVASLPPPSPPPRRRRGPRDTSTGTTPTSAASRSSTRRSSR